LKNFPNQFNDPLKFRGSMEVIRDLHAKGKDPNDDVVLGIELARQKVYHLTGEGPLRQRLAAERRKPRSAQGTQTCARETRRTLFELGFVDAASRLTKSGRDLLKAPLRGEVEKQLWRKALLTLALDDGKGNVSHPVLVLLQLLEGWPIDNRDGMELALEARDDGKAEMRRMLRLAKLPSEERRKKLGISEAQQNNARKIFPALAVHAGLIERQSRRHPYTLTQLGKLAVGSGREVRPGAARAVRRRGAGGFSSTPRRRRKGRRPSPPKSPRTATPEEQAAREQLLYERTDRHEDLLDRVIDCLPAKFKDYEDRSSYDLVADRGRKHELLLFEIKTLEADEASQARRAVGQLLFYDRVVIPQAWPGRKTLPAAVFETAIPDYLTEFLQAVRIGAMWCDENGLHAQNALGRRIAKIVE
jgi:hypothetical protein